MCQAQLSTNGYGIAGFHAHFLTLFCIRNGDRTAFRLQDLDVIFRLEKYREVYLIRTLGLSILGGNDQGSLADPLSSDTVAVNDPVGSTETGDPFTSSSAFASTAGRIR